MKLFGIPFFEASTSKKRIQAVASKSNQELDLVFSHNPVKKSASTPFVDYPITFKKNSAKPLAYAAVDRPNTPTLGIDIVESVDKILYKPTRSQHTTLTLVVPKNKVGTRLADPSRHTHIQQPMPDSPHSISVTDGLADKPYNSSTDTQLISTPCTNSNALVSDNSISTIAQYRSRNASSESSVGFTPDPISIFATPQTYQSMSRFDQTASHHLSADNISNAVTKTSFSPKETPYSGWHRSSDVSTISTGIPKAVLLQRQDQIDKNAASESERLPFTTLSCAAKLDIPDIVKSLSISALSVNPKRRESIWSINKRWNEMMSQNELKSSSIALQASSLPFVKDYSKKHAHTFKPDSNHVSSRMETSSDSTFMPAFSTYSNRKSTKERIKRGITFNDTVMCKSISRLEDLIAAFDEEEIYDGDVSLNTNDDYNLDKSFDCANHTQTIQSVDGDTVPQSIMTANTSYTRHVGARSDVLQILKGRSKLPNSSNHAKHCSSISNTSSSKSYRTKCNRPSVASQQKNTKMKGYTKKLLHENCAI
ncbi:hypothetical protein BDV3_004035 [Batrachochytrium dendrobatidis]